MHCRYSALRVLHVDADITPITTPYSAARRAIRAAWALATNALVGVQPVLTQVIDTSAADETALNDSHLHPSAG
jgi:hypothetical protein